MIEEIVEKMEEFRQLILQDGSDVCDWEWININYGVNKIQMVANYETKSNGYTFNEELTLIETIRGINIQIKDTCGSGQICIPKPVNGDLERVKKDVAEWLRGR